MRCRIQELESRESENQQVSESLRRQHHLLQTLIDLLPHRIYVKDTESRFILVNKETALSMGEENPESLIGKCDFDFLPADLAAHLFQDEQMVIRTGRPLLNQRWDNPLENRWFLTNKMPLHNEAGEIIGLVGINSNISELNQTILKLKRSEETANAILNASPDIALLVDRNGICLACNLNYLRTIKKSYDQVIGADIFSYLPPSVVEGRRKMLDRALQLGLPVIFEDRLDTDYYIHSVYPICASDLEAQQNSNVSGESFKCTRAHWERDQVSAIGRSKQTSAKEEIQRVAIFSKCITQEREAQRLQKKADQRLLAFAQALPDLSVVFDLDGRVIDVYSQPEHQWFIDRLAQGNRSLHTIFDSEIADLILENLRQTVQNGHSRQMEFPLGLDNKRHWFQGRTWTIPGEEEAAPLIVWICRDITEHKELEAELMHISESVTRQMGRDLHDTLGQNLTALLWSARLLVDQLHQKQISDVESADKVLVQIQSAIDEMRRLSRGLNPAELDERGLFVALKNLVQNCDRFSEIDCSLQAPETLQDLPSTVSIALFRLAQEAVNNAIKHSRAQKIEVKLVLEEKRLHLIVTDNGTGFDPESPDAGGMGLRTMQHRIRFVGGNLQILSQPGKGTEIHAQVPLPIC